ncbi:MAG: chemotaxis protein CheW [Desulfobacterales bacterium]|nr:chemotaxis protein CheW [Desulfobacterales bacterium]
MSLSFTVNNSQLSKTTELATFYIGEALCGIDILKVQEINKVTNLTRVPQAPEYVSGILNLRGSIVTIIDIGRKMGLEPLEDIEQSRIIIVKFENEYVGLLVDRIADIEVAEADKISPTPSSVKGVDEKFFKGVLRTERDLILILDVKEVLKVDESD